MQKKGIDYQETFSAVVRHTTLRTCLTICANEDMEMAQWDVRSAFLLAPCNEEIYLDIPPGMDKRKVRRKLGKQAEGVSDSRIVLRLKTSLYGIVQAPRNWSLTLRDYLIKKGWKQS